MINYTITRGSVKTFQEPFKPFLSFNETINIAQWYRDVHWAPDNVSGFQQDIGRVYNVWTRRTETAYHRHIFPDELAGPVTISFEIPNLDKQASFPLIIKIFDEDGSYFEHQQELVLERLGDGRNAITGWRKIPQVRNFLTAQNNALVAA